MSELFSGKNREGNLTVLRACKNGISSRDIMRLKTKGDVFNYILELKTKGLIALPMACTTRPSRGRRSWRRIPQNNVYANRSKQPYPTIRASPLWRMKRDDETKRSREYSWFCPVNVPYKDENPQEDEASETGCVATKIR